MLSLGYSSTRIHSLLSKVGIRRLHVLVTSDGVLLVSRTREVSRVNLILGAVISGFRSIRLLIAKSSSFRFRGSLGRPLANHGFRCGLFPISATRLGRSSNCVSVLQRLRLHLVCNSCPSILGRRGSTHRLLVGLTNDCLCGSVLSLSVVQGPMILRGLLITLTLRLNDRISCGRLTRAINSSDGAIRGCISLLRGYFMVFQLSTLDHGCHGRLGGTGGVCFCSGKVHGTIVSGFSPLGLQTSRNTL